MFSATAALRALLVLVLLVAAIVCGVLYVVSLDSAQNWPELAYLRMPAYLAVVVGLLPVVLAVLSVFQLLGVVERGDAFSTAAVALFRRLMVLTAVFAGYFTVGLVGFWALSGLMHPSLIIAWFALEVAALFCFATAALLAKLFSTAMQLRLDNDLTV